MIWNRFRLRSKQDAIATELHDEAAGQRVLQAKLSDALSEYAAKEGSVASGKLLGSAPSARERRAGLDPAVEPPPRTSPRRVLSPKASDQQPSAESD